MLSHRVCVISVSQNLECCQCFFHMYSQREEGTLRLALWIRVEGILIVFKIFVLN